MDDELAPLLPVPPNRADPGWEGYGVAAATFNNRKYR